MDIVIDITEMIKNVSGMSEDDGAFIYKNPGATTWTTGTRDTDFAIDLDAEDPMKGTLTWTADFSDATASGIAECRLIHGGLTYGFKCWVEVGDSVTVELPGVIVAARVADPTIDEKLDTIIEQLDEVITNTTPADAGD